VNHIDNPRCTNFSLYNDELAEELMVDSAMMEYMRCAMNTDNPECVVQAAKMISMARDKREITIRRMFDD